MKAEDGNHGIHIAANPDAVIGERGDDKFGGEVPNDYTVGMLKFTSPESIDVVIEWLWKAKRYFKENSIRSQEPIQKTVGVLNCPVCLKASRQESLPPTFET